MTVVGLDVNTTRARAMFGQGTGQPAGLDLEDGWRELPLAVSLAERRPVVGRAGASLRRKAPHLACFDFLPALGQRRDWGAGRNKLDAGRALGLVFDHIAPLLGRTEGAFLTLPPYLTDAQEVLLTQLAGKARFRMLGATPTPTAAALAAHEHLAWNGLALVVDVDDHALTWSAVTVEADQVRLLHYHCCPDLALGVWLNRLLNGAAGRCVRVSRRDPRESPDAEQAIYDQFADVMAAGGAGGIVSLAVQTPHWRQTLMLQPDEMAAMCTPLVQQALAEMQAFAAALAGQGQAAAVLATAAAGALPGLTAALNDFLQAPAVVRSPQAHDSGDFGANLPLDDEAGATRVHVLDADAPARAAHQLAGLVRRGELSHGRIDSAPLPAVKVEDGGPARLEFRGRDHVLTSAVFTLGRDPGCDLVFETELYPSVSARHCEVVFDRNAFLLRDRSRHGTLVNENFINQQSPLYSGDWIRLGPGGPVLRFLGRPAAEQRRLMPTA